ncbi:MAG: hypothetical protein LBO67_06030, partial [Spirochaetaceae bacterium]|nr:hypothetical protein [Spirochaetaceae bacterium]
MIMKKTGAAVCIAVFIAAGAYSQSFPDMSSFGMGSDVEQAMILSDMALMKLDGLIPMRFANALDGKPIA